MTRMEWIGISLLGDVANAMQYTLHFQHSAEKKNCTCLLEVNSVLTAVQEWTVDTMADDLKKKTHKDYTAWDLNVPQTVIVKNRQKLEAIFKRKARRKMKQELKEDDNG